jgi:hypothetical protein
MGFLDTNFCFFIKEQAEYTENIHIPLRFKLDKLVHNEHLNRHSFIRILLLPTSYTAT